jgi:hypothetical protein
MNLRKVISRRFHRAGGGGQVAGDVNAVVSANIGERGSVSHTSSRKRTRVVQRSGKTVVSETQASQDKEGTE